MPYSSGECKDWTRDRVLELAPQTIVDVGAGHGTYARLLRPLLPECRFVGIEVFEPYVERFGLNEWYDEIIIADVREMVSIPTADVVICGDVIEHMTFADASRVWQLARLAARKAAFVALPVVPYPQGAWEGNEHEAHLHTWDHDLAVSMPGVEAFALGEREIGAYQLSPLSVVPS